MLSIRGTRLGSLLLLAQALPLVACTTSPGSSGTGADASLGAPPNDLSMTGADLAVPGADLTPQPDLVVAASDLSLPDLTPQPDLVVALPPVYCAGNPCAAGQICCFDATSNTPPDHCGSHGGCGVGYVELSCSSPQDCPGQLCCASFVITGVPPTQFRQYTNVACSVGCDIQSGQVVVCDPTRANPCPFGGTCTPSNLLGGGYMICM
jgi:hypothetical protein